MVLRSDRQAWSALGIATGCDLTGRNSKTKSSDNTNGASPKNATAENTAFCADIAKRILTNSRQAELMQSDCSAFFGCQTDIVTYLSLLSRRIFQMLRQPDPMIGLVQRISLTTK